MVIIVLGANGFIGSHLTERLLALHPGTSVVGVASYHSDGKHGWLDVIPKTPRLVLRRGDITDQTFLKSLAPNTPDTLIYNLAAHISVPGSLDLPERYWDTNATAVLKLLLLYDQASVVQVSTSEVFAGMSAADSAYKLDSALDPVSWYGAAKAASEMLVRASNRPNHVFVRLFNTFGPRQFPRAVIPHMIREALAVRDGKKTCADLGDPNTMRGFHYVADVANALASLSTCQFQGNMQWASASPMTMQVLWELICGNVGIPAASAIWNKNQRPDRVKVQALFGEVSTCPDGVRALLGRTAFVQALRETQSWLEQNPDYAATGYYQ